MKRNAMAAKVVAACCLLVVASVADAVETGLQLEGGVGYSDNVNRGATNKVDETLAVVGLAFDMAREEGRLTGSVVGDVDYISYLDNTYDDDFYGRMDLQGAYAFVPETFSWILQNSWGQIRRDYLASPNPANQENINYFSTGPDIRLRFGQRTFLDSGGRYALATYEETPRDYASAGGWVTLGRQLDDRSDIGIRAAGYWIEFDDPDYLDDYDIQEYVLAYNAVGARTSLEVQVGYTVLNYLDETSDGPLVRLVLGRDIGGASRVVLRLGQEYTDPGRRFANGGVAPEGPSSGVPSDSLGVGDPSRTRYLDLGWSTAKERTDLSAGVRYSQENYQTQSQFDRDLVGLYVRTSRRVTERFSMRAEASVEREEYDDGAFDDTRIRLTLGVTLDLTERTFVTFEWDHFNGDSNSPTRDYEENRAWLRVGFRAR